MISRLIFIHLFFYFVIYFSLIIFIQIILNSCSSCSFFNRRSQIPLKRSNLCRFCIHCHNYHHHHPPKWSPSSLNLHSSFTAINIAINLPVSLIHSVQARDVSARCPLVVISWKFPSLKHNFSAASEILSAVISPHKDLVVISSWCRCISFS